MDPHSTHQLLLLFLRANVSKTGTLSFDELSEISWMPMLGGVATELQVKLQAEGSGCCLGPKAWLELCGRQHATPQALCSFIEDCEMMTDTFPELSLPAADDSQLEALAEIARQGGERMVNTLCLAAACGNASVAQFILKEFEPRVSADWDALELLRRVVASSLSSDAAAEAAAAGESAVSDTSGQGAGTVEVDEKEEAADEQPVEMLDVTVPDGAGGGDRITLVLQDNDEMQVIIPEGLAAGDVFRVTIERADNVAPGEEDKLHAPEGGVVIRGAGDDKDDGKLLEQQLGNYSEVAALLTAAVANAPCPEPANASDAARNERVTQLQAVQAGQEAEPAGDSAPSQQTPTTPK